MESKFKVGDVVERTGHDYGMVLKGVKYKVSGLGTFTEICLEGFAAGHVFDSSMFEYPAPHSSPKAVHTVPSSPLQTQVSGDHYKSLPIQPVEYIHANGLGFLEGNVVKYISRHKNKNGSVDIEKAIHYCQMILELNYGIKTCK